jgi:hypothetical protein
MLRSGGIDMKINGKLRRFDWAVKVAAVRMERENGQKVTEVAREPGIGTNQEAGQVSPRPATVGFLVT